MMERAKALFQKISRRSWMKYAMRGVGGADNYARLDLAYSVSDPWNLDSPMERARFDGTDRIVSAAFGRVGSILELGCGEGHQTEHFAALADQVYGLDVSDNAIARARSRLPQAQFAVADAASQPWGDTRGRFDLVTACEMLYYVRDIDATLERMSHLGRACLVTVFAPALRRVGPHLERLPQQLHKDWIWHGGTVWLVCWWRND